MFKVNRHYDLCSSNGFGSIEVIVWNSKLTCNISSFVLHKNLSQQELKNQISQVGSNCSYIKADLIRERLSFCGTSMFLIWRLLMKMSIETMYKSLVCQWNWRDVSLTIIGKMQKIYSLFSRALHCNEIFFAKTLTGAKQLSHLSIY